MSVLSELLNAVNLEPLHEDRAKASCVIICNHSSIFMSSFIKWTIVASFYNMPSKVSRIALMKFSLFNTVGFSRVVISARSFVIFPDSIVAIVAFSSLFAKSTRASMPSSSPRFLSAPVHAKIVATEFVDVSSPFKCL